MANGAGPEKWWSGWLSDWRVSAGETYTMIAMVADSLADTLPHDRTIRFVMLFKFVFRGFPEGDPAARVNRVPGRHRLEISR